MIPKKPDPDPKAVAREAVDAFFLVLMDSIDPKNKYDFGGFAAWQFDGEDDRLEQMALGFRSVLLAYYNECEEEKAKKEQSK